MGTTLVMIFAALVVAAFVQSTLRRRRNPYAVIEFAALPGALRTEIERVLPGFAPREVRLTKNRDEGRIEGDYLGEPVRVEADLDAAGEIVELEVERRGGSHVRKAVPAEDLPDAARREIDRVLGDDRPRFSPLRVTSGGSGEDAHFEMKGTSDAWRWEIAVTAGGRLLELEKESRVRRARA